MSRYRTVHCLIWNDDKFPFVSDDCQLLWFHLRTTPFSNALGCYKASIEGLAAEKRWPLKTYRKTFAEGLRVGFWKYDERFQVVYFPQHFKYNKPENPNVLRGWLKSCWSEIPDCALKGECRAQLQVSAEGWGKGFVNVLETYSVTLPQTSAKQEQEREREQEQERESESNVRRKAPSRSRRCPPDFAIPDQDRRWAIETRPDLDIALEEAKFRDHEFDKPKSDWPATWRNWIRGAKGGAKNGAKQTEIWSKFEGDQRYESQPVAAKTGSGL